MRGTNSIIFVCERNELWLLLDDIAHLVIIKKTFDL